MVTLTEAEWALLSDVADRAGMSVEDYVCWNTRALARQSRPGSPFPRDRRLSGGFSRCAPTVVDESEDSPWADSFTERLAQRVDLYREP